MSEIVEIATITSKGQITLPKVIRQALGVASGGKVVFAFKQGKVVVSRADNQKEHADPAIAGFLNLLALDIQKGRRIRMLPEKLAQEMLRNARAKPVDLDEPIEGEVAL